MLRTHRTKTLNEVWRKDGGRKINNHINMAIEIPINKSEQSECAKTENSNLVSIAEEIEIS